MGLFSKFFSKDNEAGGEAQGQAESQAQPEGKQQNGAAESSPSKQARANEKAASAAEAKAEAKPEKAEAKSEKAEAKPEKAEAKPEAKVEVKVEAKPEAKAAPSPFPPPLPKQSPDVGEPSVEAAAPPAAAKEPPALKKRDEARKQAPPALGTAAAAPAQVRAPAAPPPAAKAASKTNRAAEQHKTTGATASRAQSTSSARKTAAQAPAAKTDAEASKQATSAQGASAAQSAKRADATLPSGADVEAAVDTLFDASASKTSVTTASDEAADRRAVTETLTEIAKLHADPLRDFMFQLSVGRTPHHWAAACRPVVRPLIEASKQIGLPELEGALIAFDAALERAASETTTFIGETTGAAIEQSYSRLHQQMPDAFAKVARGDSRRLIVLESLLLQVPGLQKRTLSKLYAAGLTTLAQLSQAKPEELSAVTGIDRVLAQAVVEHVQRFERERARTRVDATASRSHLHERLRVVVGRLGQLQAEFERAEQDESSARKRAARRGREAAVLDLDLLFAEAGELGVIEELKRCAVRAKITHVESYLERLKASA